MARLRFLAPSTDLRPDKVGTTYGPGHETDFDEADYDYVISLRNEGKAEIIDATGLPATLAIQPAAAEKPASTKSDQPRRA